MYQTALPIISITVQSIQKMNLMGHYRDWRLVSKQFHINKYDQPNTFNSNSQIQSSTDNYNTMGLLYSIVSYFYNPQSPISPQKITLSAQHLSRGLKLKMTKIQKNNIQMETDFINMINQPKRDLFIERLKIDTMIRQSINYGVHEQLWYCAQRIKDEAQNISSNLNKVSNQCLASIYSIVHLYKDFGLQQYIDLKQFLPEPYPVIGIEKLQANIRQFLEYNKPTEYQRNLYVLEVIKRHQGKVSIFQLNKANHGFSEVPQIPQNEVSINSNNLYARSASFCIHEQDDAEFAA